MTLSLLPFAAAALLSAAPADTVPLLKGLGTYSRAVTVKVPAAQRYFRQGLVLAYGFNHAEAIRAYAEGERLDPSCAMCAWGIAYAMGPNINATMDAEGERAAHAAIRRAQAANTGTKVERALIAAMATRYAEPYGEARAARDSAFAQAMADVRKRFPADQDVAVIYADAMMNLRPWNQWATDGTPHPGTLDVVAALEKVIAANPNHPGACHLYIHAVEASRTPERAVPCAERLARLVPAAGHLVHMPAHVYIRVGRYGDAVKANEHAVHADEAYIADRQPSGIYPAMYYPHNIHFLAVAASLDGQSKAAIEAGDALAARISDEVLAMAPPLELFAVVGDLMRVRFGRWDAILAQPMPSPARRYATGVAWYARGRAHAATGNLPMARAALDSLRAVAAAAPADWTMGAFHSGKELLLLAQRQLESAVHFAAGEEDRGLRALFEALEYEDRIRFDEPHPFPLATRQALGAALLRAGRAKEAEVVYREELDRQRENGWSLFGLAAAQRAQGKTEAAAATEARLRKAWARADVQLASSWF